VIVAVHVNGNAPVDVIGTVDGTTSPVPRPGHTPSAPSHPRSGN